jgi:hypothetical protein
MECIMISPSQQAVTLINILERKEKGNKKNNRRSRKKASSRSRLP